MDDVNFATYMFQLADLLPVKISMEHNAFWVNMGLYGQIIKVRVHDKIKIEHLTLH